MAVSKYSQILQGPTFQARSFDELNYAPSMLRQQHDLAVAGMEENLKNARQVEVGEKYREQQLAYLDQLEKDTESLINNVNLSGVNSGTVLEDFGALKRRLDKDYSNTGKIGIAANIHARVTEADNAAMKLALEHGQDPNRAREVGEQSRKAYYDSLTNNLDDLRVAPDEYRPKLAPKSIDLVKAIEPVMRYIGNLSNSDSYSFLKDGNFQFNRDPSTGQVYLESKDTVSGHTRKIDISNDSQLSALYDYIETMVNDDTSDLAKNLEYRGTDIATVLTQALQLQAIASNRSKTVDINEEVRNTNNNPPGGRSGHNTPKNTKKEEEGDPTQNIITEAYQAGKVTTTVGKVNERFKELESKHPSERTPKEEAELNELQYKKFLVDEQVKKRAEDLSKDKEFRDNVNTDQRRMAYALDQYIKSIGGETNADIGAIWTDAMFLNLKSRDNPVTISYRTKDGATHKITPEDKAKIQAIFNKTESIPEEYIKGVAESEALKELEDNELQSNVRSFTLNGIYAKTNGDAPGYTGGNFAPVLDNIVLNGLGGGNISVLEEGKLTSYDLSDSSKSEELKSFISEAQDVTFDAIDIDENGPSMRMTAKYKDKDGTHSKTFLMPVRPVKDPSTGTYKLNENVDELLNRLYNNGSERDRSRVIDIKNDILISRQDVPIAVYGSGRGLNEASGERTSNLVSSFNTNGVNNNNNKINFDKSRLGTDYPYNRSDLKNMGIEIVDMGGKGVYYTSRFDINTGETEYMTAGNLVDFKGLRAYKISGANNEENLKINKGQALQNLMNSIASGSIVGLDADNEFLLKGNANTPGVYETYTSDYSELISKYRKMAEVNFQNRTFTNNSTALYDFANGLSNEQYRELINSVNQLNNNTYEKIKNIKVAARQKTDLM